MGIIVNIPSSYQEFSKNAVYSPAAGMRNNQNREFNEERIPQRGVSACDKSL